jgi:hypothetical protein
MNRLRAAKKESKMKNLNLALNSELRNYTGPFLYKR